MKRFSISTFRIFSRQAILGLTFGVFLAGYAVFAFQAPASAPPGGNVPAPLNTSSSDQTKVGGTLNVFGLWVNQALGVSGGATLGGALNLQGNKITNVGAPTSAGDVAVKSYVDSVAGSHVSGGLYGGFKECGTCTSPTRYCIEVKWPAFCAPNLTYPSLTEGNCPIGYSVTETGEVTFGGGKGHSYVCYKN